MAPRLVPIRYLQIGAIFTVFFVWWGFSSDFSPLSFGKKPHGLAPRRDDETSTKDEYRYAKQSTNVESSAEDSFQCIQVRYKQLSFPMCVHSAAECKFISKAVLSSKGNTLYELSDVNAVMDFLKKEPGLGLIDIGANIGTYTLPAAHMGHRVVAVEMNHRTAIRLMASIKKGNISDRVSLHNVGLSNVRQSLRMIVQKGNIGDSRLVDERTCLDKGDEDAAYYCDKSVINTILLDDLLPEITFKKAVMKIDAQGTEVLIFKNASKIFDAIDIRMVFMEWDLFRSSLRNEKVAPKTVSNIMQMVEFILGRGFLPFDNKGKKQSTGRIAMRRWPYNVLFIKRDD